ncbi:MAG: hypothetical protein Q9M39_06325 [Sulfurovum sp.]|nr:hypothetical protein [Sulfurovum sp.]
MVSNKYNNAPAQTVQKDLEENHNRNISCSFIRSTSQIVSNLLLKQEDNWEYEIVKMDKEVATISLGLDGTCMPMGESNWREAMCGTFSFYDSEGKRMHTIYIANAPSTVKSRLKRNLKKKHCLSKRSFHKQRL